MIRRKMAKQLKQCVEELVKKPIKITNEKVVSRNN